MEGKTVIYIAGNPDLYPLEYYDAETESYQGVLPQLYAQFSAHSGYELIYYPTDGEDRREALAENRQVDILSGYAPGDEIPEGVQAETVLRVTGDGETDVYTLGFTSVAPEGLQEELTEYLQSVSQESISGLLLAQAQQMRSASVPLAVTAALGVLAALLAVTVMVLVRRYRAKLRLAYAALERDSLTGLGNGTYLERQYRRRVTGKNRILYQLIYFLVDIDRLRHMGTGQETEDFLQFAAHVLQENTSANDVLARVSDQGFAMLRLVPASGGADDWIQPLLERLRNYAPEHGKPYNISVTAAIYPLQPTDTDPKEILSNANQIAHMAAR
ncbi:MAG TPA: diguanylate cyclase, partial [Candidatus Agathobaculum merdavium]|nr:diguanylate cyclase [Candidatus Agathobaculum merdavium]